MNAIELKDKIAVAEEAVKDMKDPELRKKAFEVILNSLIVGNIEDKGTVKEQTSENDTLSLPETEKHFFYHANHQVDHER